MNFFIIYFVRDIDLFKYPSLLKYLSLLTIPKKNGIGAILIKDPLLWLLIVDFLTFSWIFIDNFLADSYPKLPNYVFLLIW